MSNIHKYVWYFILGTLFSSILYVIGYQHYYKKMTFDEIFGPDSNRLYAKLTDTSFNCIGCHGKTEVRGAREFNTPWGKQTWKGYEATYIDPHAEIKTFNKQIKPKKTSFHIIEYAYAGQYDGLGNHPVGVPYPIGHPEYKNPQSPITIPNGYIQCESCHVMTGPDSDTHGDLVMSNSESRLCLGCHIK